ncbi:hypothetical protein SAMN05443637_1356 [Pseudonocardia thermophila]|jgi:hypothetical protein|uniref:PH domain-containing protein n=2 Tax=Pseudonocardia thermophila TaxID=1848 RepID=A0A1M7BDA2_PSETH|nr:hypothetical protein SAMN05443637_1356 [Pseudonocardia thermophila]
MSTPPSRPPSTTRSAFVMGVRRAYPCPTVEDCDKWLRALSEALRGTTDEVERARIRADIDAVLERRLRLKVA